MGGTGEQGVMGVRRGVWVAFALGVGLVLGACAGSDQRTGPEPEPAAEAAPATAPEDLPEVPESEVSDVIATLDGLTNTGKASIVRIVDVSGESRIAAIAGDRSSKGGEVFFDPTVLVGEAGQEITLVLANTGNHPHRFAVEELGIEVMLPYGSTGEEVTLTVPAAGDAPIVFACTTGGHDLGGMVGALVAA